MGNIIETVSMQKVCAGSPCKKIDKDTYLDIRTGEIKQYKHIENRSGSLESIRHTLADIRAVINTNVTVPENARWITLTYRENMTDTKRLYTDYEKFWKRFCYWCNKQGCSKPEYIAVIEPQGRGAWHVHAFFIWSCRAPFIPNDTMCELWGQGWTKTKAMQDCDNVGAYFSAYLCDMPLDEVIQLPADEAQKTLDVEEKQFIDEAGTIKSKKFVKGGRLHLYPAGMNIVRKSRGLKLPIVEYIISSEIEKKVCSAKQTFSRTYEVIDDNGAVVNIISKAYYNTKRK